MTLRSKPGFTLIELLVVISIISLLSGVILSSLSGARETARDARRGQDFRQIRQALEAYYNDFGHYPKITASTNFIDDQSSTPASELVGGGYMTKFPLDPIYGGDGDRDWGWDYQYRTFNNGQAFLLRTAFETKPAERTHSYPDGKKCQDLPQYPTCNWSDTQRCIYVTGSDCETYWLQFSNG